MREGDAGRKSYGLKLGEVARALREGLAAHDVACDKRFEIGRIVAELEWAASFGGAFEERDSGGKAVLTNDFMQYLHALVELPHAQRIARLLEWAPRVKDSREDVRKWIRKRLDPFSTREEESQDHLFELEVAGRAAALGLDVRMEEPDLTVQVPNAAADAQRFAFACKRPRDATNVGAALLKARDQIRRSQLPGVVLVSIDGFLHNTGDPDRNIALYIAKTPEHAARTGRHWVDTLVDLTRRERARAFDQQVIGALLVGYLSFLSRRPEAIGVALLTRVLAGELRSQRTLGIIETLLFTDQDQQSDAPQRD